MANKVLIFDETFLHRLESLALVFRQASASRLQGERRSSRRGQSIEFSDFKPYTLGDDFRRIDWNAYARLERLFIKLFVEEEDTILHLLLDNSSSMDWGAPNKLDYSKRAAAALGYIALVSLDRVAVSTPGCRDHGPNSALPPLRNKGAAMQLFSFLQSVPCCPTQQDSLFWLGSYAEKNRTPGMIVLFSDLMSDDWFSSVSLLRKRGHDVSIIHILSPDEKAPEMEGDFRLVDSETKAEVELTADFETLQNYKTHLRDWQEYWRLFCRERQILYIPVVTSMTLEDLLFAWLPKQGLIR